METQVRTPQQVFNQPQRLAVPLFQRPYVWNEETQWAPLWADVERLANRLLAGDRPSPHFLGAVVLQQPQNTTGSLQERTIIDGQQRLTTLQLLLDALNAQLVGVGAVKEAARLDLLVRNPEVHCEHSDDQFKVSPTNRDRAAFYEVMSAPAPVEYGSLGATGRLVDAHRFFSERAREWLLAGHSEHGTRAAAIDRAVRELLQVVVIDLGADENAQEIFETLNARGAQLTAADLVKNLVFQRLLNAGADVQAAYERNWKQFETGFWETEVSAGRLRYSRSSIFLNHWLVARTGEEIVAREVFSRFKRFVEHDVDVEMPALLERLQRTAEVYRSFTEGASNLTGEIDRVGLFAYRTGTLDSDVFKSVVLVLLDPEQPSLPVSELHRALGAIESWLVRRMLVRATTNSYSKLAVDLVKALRSSDRTSAGGTVEDFFRHQTAASAYWPDDDEVRRELAGLTAYTRLQRSRLRMVLEAVEDHRRGWTSESDGLGGQRVPRGKFAIEHVMPQRWQASWPLADGAPESRRDALVHVFGNLTLLTGKLNSRVSNGPWHQKRLALQEHDVLKLNRDLLKRAGDHWDERGIVERTADLAETIVAIWPTPSGHVSTPQLVVRRLRRRTTVADLIGAGLLEPGTTLRPRRRGDTAVVTVLPDGSIDVNGTSYGSPSSAASAITGGPVNGWWFLRPLDELFREYHRASPADADPDEDMPDAEDTDEFDSSD